MTSAITIRPATASDAETIRRVAALDSSRVPEGELVVAEIAGRIVAAVGPDTVVADPFTPTAAALELAREWRRAPHAPRTRVRRLLPAFG